MGRLELKAKQAVRRTYRVRSRLFGTTERPRAVVKVSNRHVTVQIVDDSKHQTLLQVSSVTMKDTAKLNMTQLAAEVGKELAAQASKKKIKKLVLDRGDKKYHGRVKALADAMRENGMEL